MAEKRELSAALKDKFKMAPYFAPGTYAFRGKEIDLTTADLPTVEEAVKNGFNVVLPVKAAAEKATK